MHKPLLGQGRNGATLAEVLIAVLAMGIGVVSLMSLFPLSILRSVRGHQLTQATILRYNAEALLDAYPRIYADPDNDGDIAEHWGTRFVVDPVGTLDKYGLQGFYMPSALYPPAAVDQPSWMRRFSGFTNNQTNIGPPANFVAHNFESAADSMATLPDSWIELLDTLPQSSTTTSVTLGTNDSLAAVPAVGISRVVLYDATEKNSATRVISSIVSPVINWTASQPVGFVVSRVRVETQERRFTWMLTCRGSPLASDFDVDVVVFFKRSFAALEETVFGGPGNAVFRVGIRTATISYTGTPPFVRKGGFVLDAAANGGYWYRIADFTDDGTGTLTLMLDSDAKNNSNVAVLPQGVVDVFALGSKSYRP